MQRKGRGALSCVLVMPEPQDLLSGAGSGRLVKTGAAPGTGRHSSGCQGSWDVHEIQAAPGIDTGAFRWAMLGASAAAARAQEPSWMPARHVCGSRERQSLGGAHLGAEPRRSAAAGFQQVALPNQKTAGLAGSGPAQTDTREEGF